MPLFLGSGTFGSRSTMQTQRFSKLHQVPEFRKRALAFIVAIVGLVAVYFNQQFDYLGLTGRDFHPYTIFIFNKSVRYLLNDNLSILLIYALFYKKSYVIAGFYLELLGLLILLPLYFTLKLTYEGDTEISSPLFSFFHRLIINPTLMILLIVGLFYQQRTAGRK